MATSTVEQLQTSWIGRMSQRMRARRFARFAAMIECLPKPLSILDLGGRNAFWERYGWTRRTDVRIVLANVEHQDRRHPNIEPVRVDGTRMQCFADRSFDVVFSNSVIEHLRTWDRQKAMAQEIQRVGKAYWVQTPNFWFPVEPHFRAVAWQWIPVWCRARILQHRSLGWRGRCPSLEKALEVVQEVRLLRKSELQVLFPQGQLWPERWSGLVKSWIVIGGRWARIG